MQTRIVNLVLSAVLVIPVVAAAQGTSRGRAWSFYENLQGYFSGPDLYVSVLHDKRDDKTGVVEAIVALWDSSLGFSFLCQVPPEGSVVKSTGEGWLDVTMVPTDNCPYGFPEGVTSIRVQLVVLLSDAHSQGHSNWKTTSSDGSVYHSQWMEDHWYAPTLLSVWVNGVPVRENFSMPGSSYRGRNTTLKQTR